LSTQQATLDAVRNRGFRTILAGLQTHDSAIRTALADMLAQAFSTEQTATALVQRNIAPTLVQYIATDDEIKPQFLAILKGITASRSSNDVNEFVENGVISVLCNVIEQDGDNLMVALE
jgi:hypothetical protein